MSVLSYSGGDLEFFRHGDGPPVILVHGSFAAAHSWKQVWLELMGNYQVYALNMPGYGNSTPLPPDVSEIFFPFQQALKALINHIGSPVYLVGHSAGGAVCLNAALAMPSSLTSLTVIEPTTLVALKLVDHMHMYQDIETMLVGYRAHIESGKAHAPQHVIDFWGGEGSYKAFPEKFHEIAATLIPQNLREWQAALTEASSRGDYANLKVPTCVVCGDRTATEMQQICQNVVDLIPDSELRMLSGASHFSPTTHPSELAAIINNHLQAHV